ncbi:MAG: signal peptide peptidase SppA [Spirochaetota bacterium]|nr:signal peptide peptidase SppA [Spirochaetota bacterium]
MKKILAGALLLLLAVAGTRAQPAPVHESVAVADSVTGGFVNPAVLSYGNGTGFGYLQMYDSEGFNEDFSFYINTEALGYAYSERATAGTHTLNLSFPIYDNLYFGTALLTEDFTKSTSSWKFGALVRPTDYLSIGSTALVPPSGDSEFMSGVAIRPLFFTDDYIRKLTVFADLPWDLDGVSSPTVGLHFEPIDGLQTRIGYDLENEALGFSLSLAIGAFRGGSYVQTDDSVELQSGAAFAQFSPKPFTYPYTISRDVYYEYDLGDEIVETGRAIRTGNFYFIVDQNTLLETLDELKQIENAPHIDGIVLVNQHTLMSYSTMLEVRDALQRIRDRGKKVVFYSDYMSSLEYILAASVGDAVYLHPQGVIDLKGMSVSSPYFKEFFDKFGIEVANFHVGEYKTAYNFLSESSMPEAEREALAYMIEGLQGEMERLISDGRGPVLQGDISEIINGGPYLVADKALETGLVDGLIQDDQLMETVPFFDSNTVTRENIPLQLVRSDWSDPYAAGVAVIHAVGPIIPGEGMPGSTIGAETVAGAIKAAREDHRIKAIILRVNSGGGSALASDIIAREVELCRTGKNAKPVIVSMTGAAASGAYYISAFADRIISSPVAITGSIGVIAVFPNFAGLLEEQMIGWDVVKQGDQADFGAMYRQLTEREKEIIGEFIDSTYNRFLTVVSEGRAIPKDDVEKIAGGRIWTGSQAMERGLVDEVGGYQQAFAAAAEAAGIKGEIELIDYTYADKWGVISLGRLPEMSEVLFDLGAGNSRGLTAALPPELEHLYRYYSAAGEGHGAASYSLMVMPYYIEDVTTK